MTEELNESTEVGNSEESVSNNEADPAVSAGESGFDVGDERFKTKEQLYKSYRDLESKVGDYSKVKSRAEQWDAAVKALAVDKDISEARAEELLAEESDKLLGKNSEKIQSREENSRIADLELQIAKRDFLDDNPEAKDVLPKVMELARATGKSIQNVYEDNFKDLISNMSTTQASSGNSYKQVRRDVDDDAPTSNARKEREILERAKSARNAPEMEKAVADLLKQRRFGS